jgi:hypothetical protein
MPAWANSSQKTLHQNRTGGVSSSPSTAKRKRKKKKKKPKVK